MRKEQFYKTPLLPFAELRHSRSSAVSFKPHMHHTLGVGAITNGEVVYSVKGKKAVLAPGSLVLINPETLHTCNPAHNTKRSYYMLHLDTDWCCRVQQSIWDVDAFTPVEKTRIDDFPLYEQFCKTMNHFMEETPPVQEKEQFLLELVCSVFSLACRPRTKKKGSKEKIDELKKILSGDLNKEFTLHSLAGEIDANPYTLIRRFKSVTGITPHAYRMNCRIEKARRLLKQGWDISETALECGFFDQSHFHRYFKAMTSVTPREYRVNFVQ